MIISHLLSLCHVFKEMSLFVTRCLFLLRVLSLTLPGCMSGCRVRLSHKTSVSFFKIEIRRLDRIRFIFIVISNCSHTIGKDRQFDI